MIDFELGTMLFLLIIYGFIMFLWTRKKKYPIMKHLILLTFFIYILLVIAVTMFPMIIDKNAIKFNIDNGNVAKNNYIPFASINNIITTTSIGIVIFKQLAGNIIMCIPFGFYIPLVFNRINSIKSSALSGFIFSVIIELSQLIISLSIGYNYRSVDVDDIILNVTGTIIGFLIFKFINPLLIKFTTKYNVELN